MPQAAGQGVALEGMPVSRTALTSVLQSSLAPWGCSGVKDQHPPPDPRVGGTFGASSRGKVGDWEGRPACAQVQGSGPPCDLGLTVQGTWADQQRWSLRPLRRVGQRAACDSKGCAFSRAVGGEATSQKGWRSHSTSAPSLHLPEKSTRDMDLMPDPCCRKTVLSGQCPGMGRSRGPARASHVACRSLGQGQVLDPVRSSGEGV